jgi:hypothetical protein
MATRLALIAMTGDGSVNLGGGGCNGNGRARVETTLVRRSSGTYRERTFDQEERS